MEDVNEQTISVKIGDEESYTLFKISKVPHPENHYLLTMGRMIEGERFGNGYQVFLNKQQLESLEKLLRFGQDL